MKDAPGWNYEPRLAPFIQNYAKFDRIGTIERRRVAVMTNAQYYRDEAERCRRLALSNPDSVAAPRWRRSAEEYELLAQSMEFECAPRPQPRNGGDEARVVDAGLNLLARLPSRVP